MQFLYILHAKKYQGSYFFILLSSLLFNHFSNITVNIIVMRTLSLDYQLNWQSAIQIIYLYLKNSNYVNISTRKQFFLPRPIFEKGGGGLQSLGWGRGVSIRPTFSCTPPGYSYTPVSLCPPRGCPRCVCFWEPPVRHPRTSPGLSWPPHSTSCSLFSSSTKK